MKLFLFLCILISSTLAAEVLPEPEVKAKTVTIPTREVSVIVTKEGYYPEKVTVFEGEKVKFFVTSTLEEPNCMVVESHEVFMAATKGKVTEAEAHFKHAGEFQFYCPSSKNNGKIIVLKKSEPKREIASVKAPSLEKKEEVVEKKTDADVWIPRVPDIVVICC